MFIHIYYCYKNATSESPKDKFIEVIATDGNRWNLTNDYESNVYKMKITYTFEKWMERLGVPGMITYKGDKMKFEPTDIEKASNSKWYMAKFMTAFEVLLYPFGE